MANVRTLRLRESGILTVLALQILTLWLIAPRIDGESTFLNHDNLMQVARSFSFIGIAAVGATFVIVSGGIDLSVGALLGLTDVVAALALAGGLNIPAAISLGLGAAVCCGLINGGLIGLLRLPPFIATLGMLSIARGAAYFMTKGRTVAGLPESFIAFGQGHLAGGLPYPVIAMLAATVLGIALMRLTRYGRHVHALGGNEEAAKLSGLNVAWLKVSVYGLAGFFAGAAGIVYVSRFGYGASTAGFGYELQVISAVVIGGTSLSGGFGSVLGSVLGAAVMGLLSNGLTLLSVEEEYNQLVVGLVIILAVLAERCRHRERN